MSREGASNLGQLEPKESSKDLGFTGENGGIQRRQETPPR